MAITWKDTALASAEITSASTADSFLKACHLTKTRLAHQVTILTLAKLQTEAFLQSEALHSDEAKISWVEQMSLKSPTFQCWNTILELELLGLIFIRAHREKNFLLYIESLKALAPWFFALDHHNYA